MPDQINLKQVLLEQLAIPEKEVKNFKPATAAEAIIAATIGKCLQGNADAMEMVWKWMAEPDGKPGIEADRLLVNLRLLKVRLASFNSRFQSDTSITFQDQVAMFAECLELIDEAIDTAAGIS
jgi:hypothetical protein